MLNKLLWLSVLAAVTGCAKFAHRYEANESGALNVARAGGIYDSDLRDSPDGMKSYSTSFLMSALNAANLVTSFQGSAIGLGGTQNFLVKNVDIMASPDNPSARPSMVAWLPKSYANNENKAREVFLDKIDEAMQLTATELGITIKRGPIEPNDPKIAGLSFVFWEIDAPKYGCTDWNCYVAVYASKPYEWPTPEFLQKDMEVDSYKFPAMHQKHYSRLIIRQKKGRSLPEKAYYQAFSKHLPAWVAFYFPPGAIHQDGKLLPYPVVFRKGEVLLFKNPA